MTMNSFWATYVTSGYLLEVASGTKYESFYLYFPIALVVGMVAWRIFLGVKGGRPVVFKRFDALWFWGYLSFALIGLLIYFSRTQGLPVLSTRLVSYIWLITILGYTGYLCFYLLKIIPGKLGDYYEKQRKKKYLAK